MKFWKKFIRKILSLLELSQEENNKIEVREGTIAGIDEYGNLYDLQLYR